jgi:hypothetical protein
MITWGRVYWPVFLLVASLLFAIPELIAIFTNAANTLSEYAWQELKVGTFPVHTAARWISLIVWLVFVAVITAHIWWRVT